MLPAEPKVGWVFRYSYLWHWQHLEGREEGDKDRLALVLAIVATLEDGTPAVHVLPMIPTLNDQNSLAHFRRPIDMMRHG